MSNHLTNSIKKIWPNAYLKNGPIISEIQNRQTDIFRPGSIGCVIEYDFTYKLR